MCFTIDEGGETAKAIELCKLRIKDLNAARAELEVLRASRPKRVNLGLGCTAGLSIFDGRGDVVCGGTLSIRLGR